MFIKIGGKKIQNRVSLVSVSESGSQKSKAQKLKIKILLNEKIKSYSILYVSEHSASFRTKELTTFGMESRGLHVVL